MSTSRIYSEWRLSKGLIRQAYLLHLWPHRKVMVANWSESVWQYREHCLAKEILFGKGVMPVLPESVETKHNTHLPFLRNVSFGREWHNDMRYPLQDPNKKYPLVSTNFAAVPTFRAVYHPDFIGISSGTHEVLWASYYEIFDMLEVDRYPDVVLLRSERHGELIVPTPSFDVDWPEARAFILEKLEEGRAQQASRRKRMVTARVSALHHGHTTPSPKPKRVEKVLNTETFTDIDRFVQGGR